MIEKLFQEIYLKFSSMIKALIFDFGNVFINLDIEKAKKDTFALLNIDSFSDEMMATNQLYEKGNSFKIAVLPARVWLIFSMSRKLCEPDKIYIPVLLTLSTCPCR